MRQSNRLAWIVAVGGAMAVLTAVARFRSGAERVPWRSTFDAACHEARSRHVPVFAEFSAAWCGPCQEMRHTTWADRDVEQALRAFVPVQVDIDRQPSLTARYAPEAVPTLVLMTADGQVLRTETGAMSSAQFLRWVKGAG